MSLSATATALLLAAAVSAHNLEEAIWLPAFRHPAWMKLAVPPFAFRLAAAGVALAFWALAAALAVGLSFEAALAGFAAAMTFNAIVPHLALTLVLRRYHPGTATAWFLVVPTALLAFSATGAAARVSDTGFLLEALAAAAALGLSLPLLLGLGHHVRARSGG